MRPSKNTLFSLLAIIVSIIFTITILEISLSIILPNDQKAIHISQKNSGLPLHDNEHHFCKGPKDHNYFDPEVIRLEYPNQQYFEFRNDIVSIHTYNQYGFRGPASKPDTNKGVIVIGDSFTRGSLADDTETIPALLDQWHPNTTFFNLGVGAHGPVQYLKTYKKHQSIFEHDTVILILYLGNDAQNDLNFENRLKEAKEQLKNEKTIKFKTKKAIIDGLNKYETGKIIWKAYTAIKEKKTQPQLQNEELQIEKLTKQIASSTQNFINQVLALNKNILIVTIPSREIFDNKNFPQKQHSFSVLLSSKLSEEIDKVAKTNHLPPPLHIEETIKKALESGEPLNKIYGFPDSHFNEYGYYLTAKSISETIEKNYKIAANTDRPFINRTNFDPTNLSCP